MPNGEFVTWDIFRKHENDSNAGFNRLSVLETEMEQIKRDNALTDEKLDKILSMLWKILGAGAVIFILMQIALGAWLKSLLEAAHR